MRCPYCGSLESQVKDSRPSDDHSAIRRRRVCPDCGGRFTTFERIELNLPLVVKKNGARVEFDRRKLRASIALALRKRPISAEQVDASLLRIENRLMSFGLRELSSDRIGELVMRELRKVDKVAYIRFASVYRSFEDVEAFADVIEELQPRSSDGLASQRLDDTDT